jgi:transposase
VRTRHSSRRTSSYCLDNKAGGTPLKKWELLSSPHSARDRRLPRCYREDCHPPKTDREELLLFTSSNSLPSTYHRDLTNAQWEILNILIPEPTLRRDGRGRPWKDRRSVLNGILWVLRTGAPWADVPNRYPSYQTCHRRFQQWVRSGVMKGVLEALALDLKARGTLDVREAFIDGSFAPAKKGVPRLEKQSVAKARKSWPSPTVTAFP